MSDLATHIQNACSLLGLRVDLGFTVSLGDGTKIPTVARIPELGPPNGMVIVTSVETFRGRCKQLEEAGYGASVISEPSEKQEFNLDSWRETFIDWGWGGDPAREPKWMTEPSLDELEEVLLNPPDEAAQEEAARQIALIHWRDDRSQQVLVDRIQSRVLDRRPMYSCIDALADIWIRRGKIDKDIYDELYNDDLRALLAPWFKELEH